MESNRTSVLRWPILLWRRETLRRVIGNSAWLGFDSILRLAFAFVVGVWVARTLGPENYGLLSYAIAFCAPFSAIVSLGLNGLVVRDLVRDPSAAGEILGTTFAIKLTAGLLAAVLGFGAILLVPEPGKGVTVVVGLVMISVTLQAGDVFDLAFQGEGRARVSAWVRSGVSLVVNGGKIFLILSGAPLIWFAGALAVESLFCVVGWWFLYRRLRSRPSWSFSLQRGVRLLGDAWPLAFAGIAIQVQAYSDQILLASLREPAEVGHYAVALRLVALFAFIPSALQLAAAPEITRAHQSDGRLYLRRLRDLYRVMFVAFVVVGLPLILFPAPIVRLLFGPDFLPAAILLPLLSLRILLTNLGVVRSLYVANEGILVYSMVTALAGAVVNIGLNLILIPRWGGLGCVVAALVSFSISTLLIEVFHDRARINLRVIGAAIGLGRLPA